MVIEVTFDVTDVYISTTVSPVYVNVSFEAPAAGGAAVWGGITGTLSNQTDLQTALDLKVPYTGATTNVNLGEYEIKAGQVTLDTSPTGTAAVGTTRWNDTLGSSETTLKGGSVILKNGVDLVARVVNKVSPNTTLTKAAYQAVRVSGAQGQRLAVAFAQANNDANSADTIGLVTETIATNQEGFIITVGQLEGVNTTGSLQGETWADGDVLYLSPFTAGAITKVKPTGNGHIVVIGYVEYAHVNNGKIYVKVMNGWELGELHDVYVPTPSNNDVLTYETSSGLWKNKSVSTALGYTPVNSATTLTINGVTYDLSTSRTWTISAGISGSGASGQVAYWTGTSAQSGSNNLFWDNANGRLGIGTNAPANELSVVGNKNGVVAFSVSNSNTGTGAATAFNFGQSPNSSPYNAMYVVSYGSGWVGTGPAVANSVSLTCGSGATAGLSFVTDAGNAPIRFFTKPTAGNLTENVRLYSTGNLLLQNGGTFTDSGERLQVTGTMKVTGVGDSVVMDSGGVGSRVTLKLNTTSASYTQIIGNGTEFNFITIGTTPITFGTNSTERMRIFGSTGNIGINTGSSDSGERLQVNGTMKVTGASTFNGNLIVSLNQNAATFLTVRNQTSGTAAAPILNIVGSNGNFQLVKYSATTTAYKIFSINDASIYNDAGGDIGMLNDNASGTIKFAAGGSSTAHMTIKSNGRINMSSLPTSSAGLATGDLWNDAGTIKIV